jgi:protein-S-isoprenylcysteine O-methyltransferase Ste14
MTEQQRDHPGVIAPPPLIYAGFLLLGFGLNRFWPAAIFGAALSATGWLATAGGLAAAGLVIAVAGFRAFRRAATAVRPDRPTTAIVTTGVFGFSRNPLYISMALFVAAIAVAADDAWMLAGLLPTMLVIRYGVVAREEAYLARKFGDTYREYTRQVRRWV